MADSDVTQEPPVVRRTWFDYLVGIVFLAAGSGLAFLAMWAALWPPRLLLATYAVVALAIAVWALTGRASRARTSFQVLNDRARWTAGFIGAGVIIGAALPVAGMAEYLDDRALRLHGVVTTATDVYESLNRGDWNLELRFTLPDGTTAECWIEDYDFDEQPRPHLHGTTTIRYDSTNPSGLCAPASDSTDNSVAWSLGGTGAGLLVASALVYLRRGRRLLRESGAGDGANGGGATGSPIAAPYR